MNTSATFASTQMILSWTLLGVLLAWMFLCIFLTLRPRKGNNAEAADLPTPSGVLPALASRSAPLITTPVDSISLVSSEATSSVGSTPVA